ncbi:hypothetical protein Hanom_Chr05g00466451 [Helianthus anomalus]
MATSPHSNPEVASSSLARSQCPYGSGFTPRLRLAGWRSARWDHLGGWEDRGNIPPPIIYNPPPPPLKNTCSVKTFFLKKKKLICTSLHVP